MITIRDATPEDASVLCHAEREIAATPGYLASNPKELLESSFRQKIESLTLLTNGKYIVAEQNAKIIAHALLDPMGLASIQHVVRLTIAVHAGHQEKGVGEMAMKHLIHWASQTEGVEKIELNVRSSNLRAVRLYQKLGFHFEGRLRKRIRYSSENITDDLEMGLFVKSTPFALPIVSLAIGKVFSSRKIAEDDNWDRESCGVELDASQFKAEALTGLDTFSHVEVLFQMNQVDVRKIETTARHPRNNLDWPKVGIFAQRGKNRPNQIGATICRVIKVEGHKLWLQGLDAIDGSPVLDIKPWVGEFGPRGQVTQPNWITELMAGYW